MKSRILIVEDELQIAEVLRDYLQPYYEINLISNGGDVLPWVKNIDLT